MTDRHVVKIVVNGDALEGIVDSRRTLVDFLRDDLNLTGTHVGCEHGVCGACTVSVDGQTVRSCLMFAVQADGCEIETVESLADRGRLSTLQQAFAEEHGLQCGFCTPGFLMAARELLEENLEPSEAEIREALSGNICRCTGYQGILRAVMKAAQQLREVKGDATSSAR